jgi:hypothetical protein
MTLSLHGKIPDELQGSGSEGGGTFLLNDKSLKEREKKKQ